MYAYTNGVLGDYTKADVKVEEGKVIPLGDLTWTPVRYGKQIWEIGTPDRTAAEFRHGDHPWTWGLYNLYPAEFPHDVDFVVGKSDPKKDWNYAQFAKLNKNGGYGDCTWRIRFNMPTAVAGTGDFTAGVLRFPRRPSGCNSQRQSNWWHGPDA